MKLSRSIRWLVFVCLCSIGACAILELRYGVRAKVRSLGIKATIDKVYEKLSKFGLLSTWKTVTQKLDLPLLEAELNYSLFDPTSHPPVEEAAARAALPPFQTIPALDVAPVGPSREAQRGQSRRFDTWTRSNGDEFSSKYSSLQQIDRNNVRRLKVAWVYRSGADLGDASQPGQTVETNPIFVNGRMFASSVDGNLLCLDATSGKEIWRTSLPPPVARRGLVWEPNTNFEASRLFVPTGDGVYAVYAASGQIQSEFGNGGQVGDQLSLIAPVIDHNRLIVAGIKAVIEAYDLRTGKPLWTTALLDSAETTTSNLSGAVPWGGMSSDPSRSAVYVSTGNPRPALVGVKREGENRNSSSVVSINTKTGAINWAFQEIQHDLWDLDVPSAPVLATIEREGRRIDVVATVTKFGNTLLLDRDFGRPIFPYRKARAPVSSVPGEKTAPYQPAIELPEPFAKQVFEDADYTDLSDESARAVKRKTRGAKYGFFEPPVVGGKIVLFGLHGGAEWPGAAVDPRTGILYVPSNQKPWVIRVEYRDVNATAEAAAGVRGDGVYQAECAGCHQPDRSGVAASEYKADMYYPALTGITVLRPREVLTSEAGFSEIHQRVKLVKSITSAKLTVLYEYFAELDHVSDRSRSFSFNATWQELLDDRGNPGSKPPWGFLSAIDLNSGRRVWQVPFGEYDTLRRDGSPVKGQLNFGGVIATAGNLVFATGTVDNKIRAFDSADGQELWSFTLPAAGSAPPMTYSVNGVQYVVVVASGGWFHGFSGRSDKIVAFKLPPDASHK